MVLLSVLYKYILIILPHAFALIGCFFLYQAIKESLFGKVPSSPAAIGRALGMIVMGQLVSFYILWYVSSFPIKAIGFSLQDQSISILHGPLGIVFSILAGYLSARTYENTKSMNTKMVACIGLLPQGLITIFNFNEGVSTYIAFWLFIPSVFIGAYIYNRSPNNQIHPTPISGAAD